jgi:histidine kinase
MKKIRKKEPIKEDILQTLAEEMDNHVDRAAKIINHMRQFGRKPDTTMIMLQINDVLEDAFNIFSQQFKLREIDVVWDLENDLPCILAEPIRLEQVFINLLTNARDAIDVKWKAEKPVVEDEKIINLHTYSSTEGVFFEISDSGIGIPEPSRNKIFEPFFTTKRIGEGTGIGLSISYGIIQDFQGNIQVLSEPGEGTSFIIRFPIGESG